LARFPLDLQRFRLVKHLYPFAEELLADATRDYCAFCLTFAPDSPPWQGRSEAHNWPDYPGWSMFFSQMSFRLQTWFYTAEGSGPPHWANLAKHRPPSVLLLLALGQSYRQPIPPTEPGQAVFLADIDLSFPVRSLPMALSHIFCRNVKNLGYHLLFFTRSEGTTLLLHRQIAGRLEGFHSDQIDLRGIRVETLPVSSEHQDIESQIAVWLDGNAPGFSPDLPKDLRVGVARGELILALLDKPRLEQAPMTSAFTRVWDELMPEPIIPYDRELRRSRFGNAYRELVRYIEKWEHLRELGPTEIRRRFHRETRFAERL
jgi:hypothetical protein